MAARGRAAQAGPLDIEGYDRQGGGVEKRRGARTLAGHSISQCSSFEFKKHACHGQFPMDIMIWGSTASRDHIALPRGCPGSAELAANALPGRCENRDPSTNPSKDHGFVDGCHDPSTDPGIRRRICPDPSTDRHRFARRTAGPDGGICRRRSRSPVDRMPCAGGQHCCNKFSEGNESR